MGMVSNHSSDSAPAHDGYFLESDQFLMPQIIGLKQVVFASIDNKTAEYIFLKSMAGNWSAFPLEFQAELLRKAWIPSRYGTIPVYTKTA